MALLPNKNVVDGTKTPATTVAEFKTAMGQLRDFLAALLGTDSSNVASARTALGVGVPSSIVGLFGAPNSTTPLTKYDIDADIITLRDTNGATKTLYNPAARTVDLGLAGSSANGRDQSAAFSANSWIYLYFIYNGTTHAGLASTTPPGSFSGSTLPAGYTHWCFATAIRWNASSNIIPCLTKGSRVIYDVDTAGTRVLSGGVSTTFATVSCASFVPPIALRASLGFYLSVVHSSNATFFALFRPTGSTKTGNAAASVVALAGVSAENVSVVDAALNSSGQFDYRIALAPSSGGGLSIDVFDYTVPNGGE